MKETQLASVQALTDTEQPADAVAATCGDVWLAPSPVIGGADVAALGNLIGASLTKRLLQPVWEKHGYITQNRSTQ